MNKQMNMWVKILIVLVVTLIAFGTITVFTASETYSLMKFNNLYYLFKAHLWKVLLALALMWYFSRIKYEYYRKYSKPALFAIIVVLALTFILAPKVKGASRWIDLGFMQFQPSEAAKVILIIHLALMLERLSKDDRIKDFKNGFMYPLIWIGIVSLLVLVQPNISTGAIIVVTSFALMFVSGARWKHVVGILGGVGIAVGSLAMLLKHSRERILDYVNSLINGGDINVQVKQAKIALGSGGLLGVGPGHSRQSDLFLPESYGDFIFSILGEEWGFVGAVLVLTLFLFLFIVCLVIAKNSRDKFGQLLVFGLGMNIILSAFINAGVVTGLLPTTGITLPFISFGGTSIILFGISVGIIINVGRQSVKTVELQGAQVG